MLPINTNKGLENIFVLQNEIENLIDNVGLQLKATDDEKIIALQLSLGTAYKIKNTRSAYAAKIIENNNTNKEKENSENGNSNA